MTKFEYKVVELGALSSGRAQHYDHFFNKWGEEGWELVHVDASTVNRRGGVAEETRLSVWKREKQNVTVLLEELVVKPTGPGEPAPVEGETGVD